MCCGIVVCVARVNVCANANLEHAMGDLATSDGGTYERCENDWSAGENPGCKLSHDQNYDAVYKG